MHRRVTAKSTGFAGLEASAAALPDAEPMKNPDAESFKVFHNNTLHKKKRWFGTPRYTLRQRQRTSVLLTRSAPLRGEKLRAADCSKAPQPFARFGVQGLGFRV